MALGLEPGQVTCNMLSPYRHTGLSKAIVIIILVYSLAGYQDQVQTHIIILLAVGSN